MILEYNIIDMPFVAIAIMGLFTLVAIMFVIESTIQNYYASEV